ncbi:MAG: TlpA family protein disulfide reductase [Gallionella sp.]|nr:TlpA family protein disulfide reductase [Gallionella sp.]
MTKRTVMPIKLLSIMLCSLLLLPAQAAERDQPKLGYTLTALSKPVPAPGFTLEDMDGKKFSLKAYRGKVVLLNFWATWCPPCRREMPSMERLYQNFKDKDFVVLAANQMEDGDQVFTYTAELQVAPTFPILFDKNSDVARAYGVMGLPTTYLIDKKGNMRFRAIGGRDFDHPEVKKQILQLMKE